MADHCSCESTPGEISILQEEMHFVGGLLLLFVGVWAAAESPRNEEFTEKELEKLENKLGVKLKGLDPKAQQATALQAVGVAFVEDFWKRKADALALRPKQCKPVINTCAVVYESADCAGGWKLPINEVPLLLCANYSQCLLFRKKGGLGISAATTSTGFSSHLKLDLELPNFPGAILMWLQSGQIANSWVTSAATTTEPR